VLLAEKDVKLQEVIDVLKSGTRGKGKPFTKNNE
jgi:hypothetical protein